MKKIITIAIIVAVSCVGCKKETPQEVIISKDLQPITVSITVGPNVSNTVAVK